MVIEHRKYERFRDSLVVVCSIPDKSHLEGITISEDISQGGIKLTAPESFPVEEIMRLDVNIYCDAVPISLRGKVVWLKEIKGGKLRKKEKRYQLGIEFIHADSLSKERILRHLSRIASKKESGER